jgi:hypothetical protein
MRGGTRLISMPEHIPTLDQPQGLCRTTRQTRRRTFRRREYVTAAYPTRRSPQDASFSPG